MAKTHTPTALMLNFRVKEDFAARLDAAAEAIGVDRSTFIRNAVAEKMNAMGSMIPDTPRPRLTPPRVQRSTKEGCPHPKEVVVRLLTGVRQCGACGAKLR